MTATEKSATLEAAGREVVITNPDKVFFREAGYTKLDLARYYAAVADGALRGIAGRPIVLKRYVNGAGEEPFFQKRAPEQHPDWVETVELRFPSGARRSESRRARRRAAPLDRQPRLHRSESAPGARRRPRSSRRAARRSRPRARRRLGRRPATWRSSCATCSTEHGLRGWPKTSGSRGIHVNVRIERRWSFDQVRRAALALAREVERRAPDMATSKWWKEERHGVFLDYNQNAKDRTVASAWSVRPTPDARVSMPLDWDEVAGLRPGGVHAGDGARRDSPSEATRRPASTRPPGRSTRCSRCPPRRRREGLGDAPWPPHYRKQDGEPPRVAPSKREGSDERRQPRPGERQSTQPLITVAKAKHKEDALAGLERWKARHPEAAALLEPGRRPRRLDARPLEHVDAHPRQPAPRPRGGAARERSRPIPTTTPGASGVEPARRPRSPKTRSSS